MRWKNQVTRTILDNNNNNFYFTQSNVQMWE